MTSTQPEPLGFFPKRIYEGIFAAFNCRFGEAKTILSANAKTDPRDALEYSMISVNASWITQAEADRLAALDALQQADKLAKAFMSEDKLSEHIRSMTGQDSSDPATRWNWSVDVRLCYAEALMNRSTLQLTLGNYIKGAYNLRKSFKTFQSIQKEAASNGFKLNQELDDILKCCLGVFFFFASFAPGMFLKVLELLGFVADRDLGMQYLETAFHNGGIRAQLSCVFLCLNYLVIPRGLSNIENNLKSAHAIIEKGLARNPNSAFLRMMDGQLALKEGEIPVAIRRHLEAIECVKELPDVPFPYYMGVAVCHFVACDWAAAAAVLHRITDAPAEKKFDMKGLAGLQLATCYFMLGEQQTMKAAVDKIPSLIAKNSRFDKLAEKKLAQYKKRGFGLAPFEVLYVRRDLHHVKPEYAQRLLDCLEVNYKQIKENPDDKASFLLIKSVLVKCLGRSDEAKAALRSILEMEKQVKEETWVMPNAQQELAEMLYWEGDHDAAEELLKKASKHSGYDWEDVVKNRIKLSLATLHKERKQEKKEARKQKKLAKKGAAKDEESDSSDEVAPVVEVPAAVLQDREDEPEEQSEPVQSEPSKVDRAYDLD